MLSGIGFSKIASLGDCHFKNVSRKLSIPFWKDLTLVYTYSAKLLNHKELRISSVRLYGVQTLYLSMKVVFLKIGLKKE